MGVRNRILLILAGFLLLVTATFTCVLYQVQLHAFQTGIDGELQTAAWMAKEVLPAGYHDRITGKESVSDEEYQRIVDRFNKICVDAKLEYLWSLMVLDGKIVFTSATSPGKVAARRDHAAFLEVHSNPELYAKAFSSMRPDFRINTDKWGRIRVALAPFSDSHGRKFLIGASRSMQQVDAVVHTTLITSILVGLGVLLVGSSTALLLANSLSRPIEQVTKVAAHIAKGDFSQLAHGGGPRELTVLAQSINLMSQAIQQRMQALRQSENLYRLISNNTADVIWTLDLTTGRFSYCSPSIQKLRGYTEQEALEQTMRDALTPESYDRVAQPLARRLAAFAAGDDSVRVMTQEVEQPRKDGSIVFTEVVTTLIADGQGKACEILGVSRDIAERKRLEAQLAKSQKMEAIGRLAGGVAHDFRNQLMVIKGYAEMLLRKPLLPQDTRTPLDEIMRAANRGVQLTGQLLAFSRRDMLQPRVASLASLIDEMAASLRLLLGEDIDVQITSDGDEAVVDIAANQFEHAVMNLAANARDAMPDGGRLILHTDCVDLDAAFLGAHPHATPGRYARLTITDSGVGMDQATLGRLFEPFFTTKAVGKGTGLGLAMVYGFVQQSSGVITVDSRVGGGTAVTMYFPRTNRAIEPVTPPAAPSPTPGGSETILVVEDEHPIRQLLLNNLGEVGYTVLGAASAAEACRIVETHHGPIHLLITDVVMPGGSGLELARQLRATGHDIPVLFMSGYGGQDLEQRGINLEHSRLLVKPVQHGSLIRTVRQLLDEQAVKPQTN